MAPARRQAFDKQIFKTVSGGETPLDPDLESSRQSP